MRFARALRPVLALAALLAPAACVPPSAPAPPPRPLVAAPPPAVTPPPPTPHASLCGPPPAARFRAVRLVRHYRTALPRSGDGCAIVSFALDAEGRPAAPSIALERPRGSGVGAAALAYVIRNIYAPRSRHGDPHRFFALTVIVRHVGGHTRIATETAR